MDLVLSSDNDCVAASLAMLFDRDIETIKSDLFTNLERPFPTPWAHLPKVPDMNVICDWAWWHEGTALVPFEYDPYCTPHADCPPVPVWSAPNATFDRQLGYGKGLLEGRVEEKGHMCAWDGRWVYDPRGYTYSNFVALEKFGYRIRRFWLAVQAD